MKDNTSKNIKYLREKLSITQRKLAEIIGKKKSIIGAYESGVALPPNEVMMIISDEFQVSIDDIIRSNIQDRDKKLKTLIFYNPKLDLMTIVHPEFNKLFKLETNINKNSTHKILWDHVILLENEIRKCYKKNLEFRDVVQNYLGSSNELMTRRYKNHPDGKLSQIKVDTPVVANKFENLVVYEPEFEMLTIGNMVFHQLFKMVTTVNKKSTRKVLWSHIALLEKELYKSYKMNLSFRNALRKHVSDSDKLIIRLNLNASFIEVEREED